MVVLVQLGVVDKWVEIIVLVETAVFDQGWQGIGECWTRTMTWPAGYQEDHDVRTDRANSNIVSLVARYSFKITISISLWSSEIRKDEKFLAKKTGFSYRPSGSICNVSKIIILVN